MSLAARVLLTLAAISFSAGCQHVAPARPKPTLTSDVFAPSPRLIVGRVVATDPARGFAFVELTNDAPPAAIASDVELIARTSDLRETARLRTSRQLRGRILGATIVSGKPGPDDEVVWLAP